MSDEVIETVAEAIWEASPGTLLWNGVPDDSLTKGHYRRMAEAAVAALGLTEEWGHAIIHSDGCIDANANVYFSEAEARKSMREINEIFPDDRRRVVSRFGRSSWAVGVGEQPQ